MTALQPFDAAAVQTALWTEGYFVAPPCVPSSLLADCRAAIEAAHAAGVSTVAAFAFDAPWQLAIALGPLAEAAIGAPALRLPAWWAWWVGGDGESRGWPPHRDNPERDVDARGAPDALTLWVPITDATADNGCMYVVPAPWDIQYANPHASDEILSLQTIRAVPAPAGAVLGWTSKLLHWGGQARPGAPPRLSVSIEFQRADRPRFDGTASALDELPPPAARRAAIEDMWQRYQHAHREPPGRAAALAEFLARTLG